MIHNGQTRVREATLKARGARECKEMILNMTVKYAGVVANHATLKEIAHGKKYI